MIEEANEKINRYFKRSFPELSQDYVVSIKPNTGVDLNNNEAVRNIVNSFYLVFLSREADATSRMYILASRFASLLNDPCRKNELEKIFLSKEDKLPVPVIELTLVKYLSTTAYPLRKKIRNGRREYSIGQLVEVLQERKLKIFEIFGQMYDENDIQIPFTIPSNFNTASGDIMKM